MKDVKVLTNELYFEKGIEGIILFAEAIDLQGLTITVEVLYDFITDRSNSLFTTGYLLGQGLAPDVLIESKESLEILSDSEIKEYIQTCLDKKENK